jgi:lysyl-tRNA synthetase class 2
VSLGAIEWRPGASLDVLRLRARMLAAIRDFFDRRGLLEVTTPSLSQSGLPDPNLGSFAVAPASRRDRVRYLNTSPEFAMKRLLAAGAGSIYQIGPVYRQGEVGARHNPEFTLVEWYRPGLDLHGLMSETLELVLRVLPADRVRGTADHVSYREAFRRHLGADPFEATVDELERQAVAAGIEPLGDLDRDGWLDLLLSHRIAPRLDPDVPTFIHSFPASQAALARLDPDDSRAALRFELYLGGLELANGFDELGDAGEQRARFLSENEARGRRGLEPVPIDQRFLAALASGMPDCVGVALGFDRLVMLAAGLEHLDQAMAFSWSKA